VSAAVTFQPSPAFGNAVSIPRRFTIDNAPGNIRSHDITPDGKKFIGITSASSDASGASDSEIRVVLNWFDELAQRLPVKR